MKKIKLLTVDKGPWVPDNYTPLANLILPHYKIEISSNPDFLFYSCFGTEFLNYGDCIRIFFCQENVRPDFNQCDYAIAFDRMTFGDRYIRQSVYTEKPLVKADYDYTNRKFCNFVYSQATDGKGASERLEFCKFLSGYKHIDCPGAVLNNMKNAISQRQGHFRPGKIKFLENYKFTIAWENSYYPGYISEKLQDPFLANSIPIYMGDPDVAIDFNPKAFINCQDYHSWDDILEHIVYLDTHPEAYMEMLLQPAMQPYYREPDIEGFLINIFENGRALDKNIRNNFLNQPYFRQKKFIENIWQGWLRPIAAQTCADPDALLQDALHVCSWSADKRFAANIAPLMDRLANGMPASE